MGWEKRSPLKFRSPDPKEPPALLLALAPPLLLMLLADEPWDIVNGVPESGCTSGIDRAVHA